MTITSADRTRRINGLRAAQLWDGIQHDWAGDDPLRWKMLASVHLRLHCRWQLPMISRALGHPKGHIARMLADALASLQVAYAGVPAHRAEAATGSPLYFLLTASPEDLEEVIDTLQDEIALWKIVRRRQQRSPLVPVSSVPVRREVIRGSLRDRIAEYLERVGPSRSRAVARSLGVLRKEVRGTLHQSPEFLRDEAGRWSLVPFEQQAAIGPDTAVCRAANLKGGGAQ